MFISGKIKKIIFLAIFFLVLLLGFRLAPAFAQNLGLNEAANLGLPTPSTTDLRLVIVNVIRFVLGFLGLIATVMILYGGWLWMTSAGNPQQVQKAKQTLIAAVIGLIIIIAAFAIVTIIIGFIQGVIIGPSIDSCNNSCDYDAQYCCPGAPGTCTDLGTPCSSVLPPAPGNDFRIIGTNPNVGAFNVPRNVVVRIYFSHNLNNSVDVNTVLPDNFTVTRIENNINTATTTVVEPRINGNIYYTGSSTINFANPSPCLDENNTPNCFPAWSTYRVVINAGAGCGMNGCIVDIGGRSLNCNGLCNFIFHTNNLIDTLPPTAGIITTEICYDDGSLPARANSVGGWGRDDIAVDHLHFYLDGASVSGDFPDSGYRYFYKEYKYDTAGLIVGSTHNFSVRAYDMIANMANASFTATVRRGHCCNGVKDTFGPGDPRNEEEIDCGGSECDSCASMNPIITNILPDNGATGNFITISGRHFGAATGSVFFSNDASISDNTINVLANFPNPVICPNSWQDNQVIVVVPAGASMNQHPIKLVKADLKYDTTATNSPPQINFTRNDIIRPGLCSVLPQQGYLGDLLLYRGNNFPLAIDGTVRFGNDTDYITANNIQNWTGQSVGAQVPNITRGLTTTYIRDNNSNVNSNPYYFTVLYNAANNPIIDYISPAQGTFNQYITIYGSGFMGYNAASSKVNFVFNNTNASTTAAIDFPEQCRDNWWHDNYIIVKVPASAMNFTIGNYRVVVTNGAGNNSNAVAFPVINGTAGPGICKLDPDNGPVNTPVNIYGDNFADNQGGGDVFFYNNATANVISWANQKINANVPVGAVTGPVHVDQNGTSSNSLPFSVGTCKDDNECAINRHCCTSGQWAGICRVSCVGAIATTSFGWTFSTIPAVAPPAVHCNNGGACNEAYPACGVGYICDPAQDCTCQPAVNPVSSCQGRAEQTNRCDPLLCPNSPGRCSPHASTGNVPVVGQNCDDTCATGVTGCTAATCDYDNSLDTCVLVDSVCAAEFPDNFGNNLTATCVAYQGANHWQVATDASCPPTIPLVHNWVRINNNYCVDTLSTCDPCPANFSCRDYGGDKRCVYSQRLCSGEASCVGAQCVISDKNSCECCCRKTNTNEDCCAPLTCTGACGAETDVNNPNLGLCSGCANTANPDAACNCVGQAGKYCSTAANPAGVCLDCAGLSAGECVDHPACCVDQKAGGNCRGLATGGTKDGLGNCEYYSCDTSGAAPACVANNNGSYNTQAECGSVCGAGGGGERCVSSYAGCDIGASTCSVYFGCLNDPLLPPPTGACRCCCNPNDNTCPNGMQCLANKGSCTGATRGLCCGCTSNSECAPDGCGKDTCCHARPQVIDDSIYPASQADGVCRNTLISATFDTKMDIQSFTGNLILLGDYGAGSCPAGTQYLAVAPYQPKTLSWLEKIKNVWQRLLAVIWPTNNALAQFNPVSGHTYCALKGQTSGYTNALNQSVLNFSVNQALDATTTYFVIITGDTNLDNSRGVLSIDGVGMDGPSDTNNVFNGIAYHNSYIWAFRTGGDICLLDNVVVEPASYLFTMPNSNQDFVAEPHAANDQIINRIAGVYYWTWSWKSANPAVVSLIDSLTTIQTVTSQNIKDARTTVSAAATITDDIIGNTTGQSIIGSADIYVFLCENPWPPRDNVGDWAPWREAANNCSPGLSGLGCNNSFNYELYYCRDAGQPGTFDDLPAILSDQAITRGISTSSLKETYFFREQVPAAMTSSLTITDDGDGNSVTVGWNDANDVNTYRLYWGRSHGNYTDHIDVADNNSPNYSQPVAGLTRNAVYYFLLDGISGNRVERALYNEATSSPHDVTPPAAPINLTAATTTTGVQLSWDAVTDANSYKVYYGTTAGTYGQSQNVGKVTEVIVTGLAGNNTYHFTVTAIDAASNESVYAVEAVLAIP